MKYGWVCKRCGWSVFSNNKEEIQLNKEYHKIEGCRWWLRKGKTGIISRREDLVPEEQRRKFELGGENQ